MSQGNRTAGKTQPAEADQIQYKAYARKFDLGPVLFLTATCSYPVGPYEIFWLFGIFRGSDFSLKK